MTRERREQPHEIVAHRAGHEPRVHPVQRAAVAGHEGARILDAHLALEHGYAQVAQRSQQAYQAAAQIIAAANQMFDTLLNAVRR